MTTKQLMRIAAALVAVVFLWGLAAILRNGGDAVERSSILGPFVEERIDQIEISSPAETLSVTRASQGWRANGFEADRDRVQDFFGAVGEAVEGNVVARSPSSHARMGVDGSVKRLRVFQADQVVADLYIGNRGRPFNSIFVRVAEQDPVYLIEGPLVRLINRNLRDWRDKRIVGIDGEDIRAFEFARADTAYRIQATESAWEFANGDPTDSLSVARFLMKFDPLLAQGAMFATPEQADSIDFENADRRLLIEGADGVPLAELLFDEASNGSGFWVREAAGGTIYQVMTYKANEIVPLDNTFQVREDSTAN
ncbi:MAG: DUF4340 domain-containing protein [Gemmatimonadales bacterium]